MRGFVLADARDEFGRMLRRRATVAEILGTRA